MVDSHLFPTRPSQTLQTADPITVEKCIVICSCRHLQVLSACQGCVNRLKRKALSQQERKLHRKREPHQEAHVSAQARDSSLRAAYLQSTFIRVRRRFQEVSYRQPWLSIGKRTDPRKSSRKPKLLLSCWHAGGTSLIILMNQQITFYIDEMMSLPAMLSFGAAILQERSFARWLNFSLSASWMTILCLG